MSAASIASMSAQELCGQRPTVVVAGHTVSSQLNVRARAEVLSVYDAMFMVRGCLLFCVCVHIYIYV